MKKWIKTIAEYIAQREGLCVDDIFLVWSCKTLQNRKAIFGCTRDQQLWEATYNGDKDETYIDRYQKFSNWVLKAESAQKSGKNANITGTFSESEHIYARLL